MCVIGCGCDGDRGDGGGGCGFWVDMTGRPTLAIKEIKDPAQRKSWWRP